MTFLEQVKSYIFNCKHGLCAGWFDQHFRKQKSKMASVTQFKCKCIWDAIFVSPVHRAARTHIWKRKFRESIKNVKCRSCWNHQRLPVAFCLWDSVSILATSAVLALIVNTLQRTVWTLSTWWNVLSTKWISAFIFIGKNYYNCFVSSKTLIKVDI